MNQTASGVGYCGSDDLVFYIHDDGAASFRFEIDGSLSGKGARELEQAWRTASSIIGDRPLVIRIGNLTGMDPFGRALIRMWHEAGAVITAKSPLARTLIASITCQPLRATAEATSHKVWHWLLAFAIPLFPLVRLFLPAAADAAILEPTTSKAWEEYVESANNRMEQRLSPGKAFLWVDEDRDRLAKVRAGEIVVSPVGEHVPQKVPSGLIHDWVGAVFIPGVTLGDVLQSVRDYARYKESYQPIVADSKVIATSDNKDRFSMRFVNRSLLLKTAFDSEYESCFVHVDGRRVYSVSRTTRIQEIEEYGAPAQHALGPGEGSGIIWRLFSIARYVERDGGVYLEVEAIGLSRDIPVSIRWLVEPIVRRISRGSLSTSLRQTEDAVRLRVALANRKTGIGGANPAITIGAIQSARPSH